MLLGILVFFVVMGDRGSDYVLKHREKVGQTILGIENIIKADYEGKEILYVKYSKADEYSVWPKYLQFVIPKNTIRVVESISEKQKDLILINNSDIETKNNLEQKEFTLLYKGTRLSLYKKDL